ncbi:MAG: aminotransferase class I/II-fold pyridoxal phosphate-dependent enzyme [Muribaculum sp.]|nr:aminotransferase class I/II-fold pyridoxal phosphate-dependent enzyme [Muribaculum sp.]
MQAIILAAGMGRRLGEFTASNTKCMVKVNGIRLIDRMMKQLSALSLHRIVVVIGYEGAKLRTHLEERYPQLPLVFIENPVYDRTNNIYSLWLARPYMDDQTTLLLESDLIFEDAVLQAAVDAPYANCALVSKYQPWNDGTMVRIDNDGNISSFIPKRLFDYNETPYYYKTVNIYKFSRDFLENVYMPFLEAYIKVIGENEYYEQVLRVITLIDKCDLKAYPINGLRWYEIDDVQDLRIAETMFADPSVRLKKLESSYGGYWRYPGLLDFCYLVNPYFPRQRMIDEMKANFEILLRDYPSGMDTNTLLASRYFGIKQKYVCVGNGAAELIKSLTGALKGKIGVVYPTFEEYPNRMEPLRMEKFYTSLPDFRYTADDLMSRFDKTDISSLIVVNPDNPSGNFIPFEDLERLCEWSKERGIRLVIDESFIDFADTCANPSLLRDAILERYPNLVVVKSISKSYGVPGLRLGVLASSDSDLMATLRKDVAIWNINSFAEYYMQIFSKYESDYQEGCRAFREERRRFHSELGGLEMLRVIPSQANYFLCQLKGIGARDLATRLLSEHNILIKDCSRKKGIPEGSEFIRIAIRDKADNTTLIRALREIDAQMH